MSDAAITKDSLYHYDNRHIQVRWDFFELCAYDKAKFNCKLNGKGKIIKDEPNQECAAKILRILETLTNHEKLGWYLDAKKLTEQGLKPPSEPKEFPIQLSYGAICDLLYNTYGESTVRNTVAFLIHLNFIKQHQQTKNSIPFYVLRTDVVQKALKDQAEKSLSGVEINSQSGESFQVLKSTARRPKSTAKPLISKDRSSEINSQTSEINSNNNSKNSEDKKEGEKESAQTSANSQPDDSLIPSSTPSLSLDVDNPVDKQASVEHNDTQPLIAKETTSENERENGESNSVESLTTGNDSKTYNCMIPNDPSLTADQSRIAGYLEEMEFDFDPTETNKGHLTKLAKKVHSLEQMKSLLAFTQRQEHLKGKTVFLGNLANTNNLLGWKQEQMPVISFQEKKQQVKTRKQAQEEWVASLKADPWK